MQTHREVCVTTIHRYKKIEGCGQMSTALLALGHRGAGMANICPGLSASDRGSHFPLCMSGELWESVCV